MGYRRGNVSLYPLLSVNFIGTLSYGIVLPFLIFLVTRFGGNAVMYGIIAATYPAFQLIGAPILGRLSDVHGRRKILLLSQIGTLIAWLIFLVALFIPAVNLFEVNSVALGSFFITIPLVVLFSARALDGITGGNISVANAYLADITKEKDRTRNFGKMSISSNMGFILGPALGGLLAATVLGETLPILAAVAISIAGTLLIAFRLPESKQCIPLTNDEKKVANVAHSRITQKRSFAQDIKECYSIEAAKRLSILELLKLNGIAYIFTVYFLIFLGFSIFYTAFPVHAAQTLGWSIGQLGIFLSFLSIVMVIVQGPVLSRLSKRVSEGALTVVGCLILGVNFLLLTSSNITLIYLAAVLFALGNGIMWPSVMAILSRYAGDTHQGAIQGLASSFGSLASIIGLVFGGILYGTIGVTSFIIASVVIFIVAGLSIRFVPAFAKVKVKT